MKYSNRPLLSVIVTAHLRPQLLARSIASVKQQEISSVEILVCADESSSETKSVALDLLEVTDSFLATPGLRGPSQTRNIGVSVARGDWICFLDDDDSFDVSYFSQVIPILRSRADRIYFCNYQKVVEDRAVWPPTELSRTVLQTDGHSIGALMVGNFIPINALFIPSSFAKGVFFDEFLRSHEDWEYLIALSSRYQFQHLDFFGAIVHSDGGLSRNGEAHLSLGIAYDYLSIYRKWPANSSEVLAARHRVMSAFGQDIPIKYL
jgi:glycosyltransferase involved in cell wall biosynthesis